MPPSVPTSFVPHPAASAPRKQSADLAGVLGFLAYAILFVVFLSAIGIFFYARVLTSQQSAEDAALAKVETTINPTTIDSFVRLRDRLASGKTLLANHIAFSKFFTVFGTIMPTAVRFSTLHLSMNDNGTVSVNGSGTAKSFNALAFASTEFATDGHIKNAIFSGITINAKDGSVSFILSATLDPKTVAFSP